jgi:hypothetical protein
MKVSELFRSMIFGRMVPSATFRAAISETVPCRTYSNSRRSGRCGAARRVRCLRDLAWMPVFVRHEALCYRVEMKGAPPLVCRSRLVKLRAA